MKTVYFDNDIPRILATKSAARFRLTRGLLFTGINAVKYKTDIPDPPLPADNWVRVKNIVCGVCGTDVSFFKATTGTNSALEPIPSSRKTFLGHENIGVVTEVGPSVIQVQVGDRVGIRAYMAGCDNKDLPRCRNCAAGNYSICENYGAKPRFDLPWTGAGWSDSFIAPQQQLYKILPELTVDQAVMVETSAVAVHAVLLDRPKAGEKIVVMGCGVIGLSIIQALKVIQPDCEIWAMSRTKDKLDFAQRLGADHILTGDALDAASRACGGSPVYQGMSRKNRFFFGGFDRAYDCIGGSWANTLGVRLLRARGTFVKVGHHMNAIKYDETPVWWQELRVIGVDSHGMEDWEGRQMYTFDLVQEWIRDGKYTVDGFVSHHFPLDDYRQALQLAMENPPGVFKIVLDC